MFKYIISVWWNYFGKIRKYGLVGEGVSLGVGFEVVKAHSVPSEFSVSSAWWLLSQHVTSQLLLQHHARRLAALLAPHSRSETISTLQ